MPSWPLFTQTNANMRTVFPIRLMYNTDIDDLYTTGLLVTVAMPMAANCNRIHLLGRTINHITFTLIPIEIYWACTNACVGERWSVCQTEKPMCIYTPDTGWQSFNLMHLHRMKRNDKSPFYCIGTLCRQRYSLNRTGYHSLLLLHQRLWPVCAYSCGADSLSVLLFNGTHIDKTTNSLCPAYALVSSRNTTSVTSIHIDNSIFPNNFTDSRTRCGS